MALPAQPHANLHYEDTAGRGRDKGKKKSNRKRGATHGASFLPRLASLPTFDLTNPLGIAGRGRGVSQAEWSKQTGHMICGPMAPSDSAVHPFFEQGDGRTVVARNLLYKESCDADYAKVRRRHASYAMQHASYAM
jgi:hypothetical protein